MTLARCGVRLVVMNWRPRTCPLSYMKMEYHIFQACVCDVFLHVCMGYSSESACPNSDVRKRATHVPESLSEVALPQFGVGALAVFAVTLGNASKLLQLWAHHRSLKRLDPRFAEFWRGISSSLNLGPMML